MGFLSDVFKGSGGSIISGALGAVTGLLGTQSKNDNSWALANMNAQAQRDFAQNSIRWKVEDAKRAGVHPLAALGVAPASFSPVSASFGDYSGVAGMLSDMGQNIDRAAMVGKDNQARDEAKRFTDTVNALTIDKMKLENDLIRAEIASKEAVRNTALPPSAPPVDPGKVSSLGSAKPQTGLISREDAANHIWNMGHGNYAIYWNPNFTQTIGDEAGQVFNLAHASKNAYGEGVFIDPESGVTYVYNEDSGWWNRLDSLDDETLRRMFGNFSTSVPARMSDHAVRNRHRYRW